jgi:hypothetical protein
MNEAMKRRSRTALLPILAARRSAMCIRAVHGEGVVWCGVLA